MSVEKKITAKEMDILKPKLVDHNALQFWQKNFGTKKKVSKSDFLLALKKLLRTHRNETYCSSAIMLNDFAELLVKHVFCPFPEDPDHVDTYCIQFAVNTFGHWKQIFGFIASHLMETCDTYSHFPLTFFHGRISKAKGDKYLLEKTTCSGTFLIRYATIEEMVKHDAIGGLTVVYTWAKYHSSSSDSETTEYDSDDEPIIKDSRRGGQKKETWLDLQISTKFACRKKPYRVKSTCYPPSWTWLHVYGTIRGAKVLEKQGTYTSFLNYMSTRSVMRSKCVVPLLVQDNDFRHRGYFRLH